MSQADIRVVDGKLIFGMEQCICRNGKVLGRMTCPKCKGTERTKGGLGKGRCRECLGGKVVDFNWDNAITCSWCNGAGIVQANSCSFLPKGIFPAMTFKVFRIDCNMTWNESHLGIGYVYSCTDYGDAYGSTDEQVIDVVKAHDDSVQACKIAKDDGTLCQFVAIIVKPNGYSVKAIYNYSANEVNL